MPVYAGTCFLLLLMKWHIQALAKKLSGLLYEMLFLYASCICKKQIQSGLIIYPRNCTL